MSTTAPTPGVSTEVMDGRRTLIARDENMRHFRHDRILAEWPVLGEPWAAAVESARISAIDRTPGNATFGR